MQVASKVPNMTIPIWKLGSQGIQRVNNGTLEFFLNVSLNSVTKIFVITVKGLEPATTCVRDQDAATAAARHM